jgi:hypothetical protein
MTIIIFIVFAFSLAYLILKKRGRAFLEWDEGYVLAIVFVLCVAQKIIRGYISLSDVFITPFYISIMICVGHARGSAQGAMSGFLSAFVIAFCSICFTHSLTGKLPEGYFPIQHLFVMALWMIMGAMAGMKEIPKAIKPVLAGLWLLLVATYQPQFLKNLSCYIILFSAVAISSLGLYFNVFRKKSVTTIHYPTGPSRRATD